MESGVTSSRSRSCTVSLWSPPRMAACTAAPYATASSGLMLLQSSFPLKKSGGGTAPWGCAWSPPRGPPRGSGPCPSWRRAAPSRRGPCRSGRSPRPRRGSRSPPRPGPRRRACAWRARRRSEAAQGALVAGVEQVLLGLALELRAEVVEEAVVEVLPAEVGVAGGGLDLEDALLDGQQGDVEGPALEVEDDDVAL